MTFLLSIVFLLATQISDLHPINVTITTNQQDNRAVYIAGNFNDWKPGLESYRLRKNDDHTYQITLNPKPDWPDTLEFRFTRENWNGAAFDEYGNDYTNRIHPKNQTEFSTHIYGWKVNGKAYKDEFNPIIATIDKKFEIPQLIKTRRITALLPYDYHQSDKKYPVLYLQDGQNLFDDFAPFGSWELDKKLAFLAERGKAEFIVVAIDHAESERIAEFTPSTETVLGVGDGEKYARFLAETLKPWVDANFRTRPEPEHTGIGGSSMGGLVSLYAARINPKVYQKLLIFSPSLWVKPEIVERFVNETPDFRGKIYLYGGDDEGASMVPLILRFEKAVAKGKNPNIQLQTFIKPGGTHSEKEWAREFPRAVEWLFEN